MCEIFDVYWKVALGVLLAFSIFVLLLRAKFFRSSGADVHGRLPALLPPLIFWGKGFVAVAMLFLMVMSFICVGSPGDIKGIVPN